MLAEALITLGGDMKKEKDYNDCEHIELIEIKHTITYHKKFDYTDYTTERECRKCETTITNKSRQWSPIHCANKSDCNKEIKNVDKAYWNGRWYCNEKCFNEKK